MFLSVLGGKGCHDNPYAGQALNYIDCLSPFGSFRKCKPGNLEFGRAWCPAVYNNTEPRLYQSLRYKFFATYDGHGKIPYSKWDWICFLNKDSGTHHLLHYADLLNCHWAHHDYAAEFWLCTLLFKDVQHNTTRLPACGVSSIVEWYIIRFQNSTPNSTSLRKKRM